MIDHTARLAQIRARLEKATSGKWYLTSTGNASVLALWVRYKSSAADVIANFTVDRYTDADFIAHSPEDIAYLLAALEEAQQAKQLDRCLVPPPWVIADHLETPSPSGIAWVVGWYRACYNAALGLDADTTDKP